VRIEFEFEFEFEGDQVLYRERNERATGQISGNIGQNFDRIAVHTNSRLERLHFSAFP
jgi:hypothetical protein